MKSSLTISHLNTFVGDKQILFNLSCSFVAGKVTVLMGPNGSGKSTLAHAIMGEPKYKISNFKSQISNSCIRLGNKDISELPTEERARMGIFLSFQSPVAVPGVSVMDLLKIAMDKKEKSFFFERTLKIIKKEALSLHIDPPFLTRGIHDGFSGGERKKIELLQALVLNPSFALFDEIDTGVDIDALHTIAKGIQRLVDQGTGVVLITHNERILQYNPVDAVIVMKNGKIAKTGGQELIKAINRSGYKNL